MERLLRRVSSGLLNFMLPHPRLLIMLSGFMNKFRYAEREPASLSGHMNNWLLVESRNLEPFHDGMEK